MSRRTGIYVEGLREYTRALEKAGVEAAEFKEVMGEVAAEGASTMRRFIPVRTGRLRDSARGNRAKGKAVVTVGRARVPYAGPIQYGWPRRGIRPARFVEPTDRVMETKAADIFERGFNQIIERHGLG